MEESSDALDSAVYAAELYNQIKQEQVMGLNSIMGQGMISNAQNSLMGGSIANGAISNAQQASWNAAQLAQAKSSYPYKENKPRVSMELSIIQADNGFIVNIGEEQYTGRTPHVAMTIEDVCTIITSQLASRMLDRTE
jgi:hypothetical protein